MPDAVAILPVNKLPAHANCGETLAWVGRMRRVLDRWETLPEYASRSMTPELRKQAHEELDEVERMVNEIMALPEEA
jgi:hypothetical protein